MKTKQIPNFDRYKQIIEWWISGGLKGLNEELRKSLYRLINKYGKKYSMLNLLVPRDLLKDKTIGDNISLNLIGTTTDNLDSKDKVTIKNSIGIDIGLFGFEHGNIYKNEIITFGKFKIVDSNTLELVYKKDQSNISEYDDLILKVNNISKPKKQKNIDINELKSRVLDITK